MPKSFEFQGKRIETDRFLIVHELIEKALLDELGLHYLHAHQIALRTERAAVEAAGISWASYHRFTQENSIAISAEHLKRVPSDLDLTPYRDEHDLNTLKQMISAERVEP
jgi:hypothetical protein